MLSVSSMSSTSEKYVRPQALTRQDPNMRMLREPCLRVNYSYYLTSATKHDSLVLSFI